ncbi:MAG: sulfatase [Candidatus Promineifilaceae bacterium]
MPQKPDIIFIVLDTQRADRLGCYGHKRQLTPNLDRFAKQGVQFMRGIAPAQWTIPSHASMFTGLYPTAHQVTQSNHTLSWDEPVLAEQLEAAGYETVAFCNNPLVGVLDNGFKRGFGRFFNYGGAAPNPYNHFANLPAPLQKGMRFLAAGLRRVVDPIGDYVGRSDWAFRLSINAWFTPIWSRIANFKGQNERSTRHITQFLQDRESAENEQPLFLFFNLMETHFPFWPPAQYIEQVAPYLLTDPKAQEIMQRWNREAYRWAAPLAEPLDELEERVLNDLYDAEVAYQDAYLAQLFAMLEKRDNAENTLIIIAGDHGDGLGDHDYVGHAFNAYQELVHVPLLMSWPREVPHAQSAEAPVSTRRVYHTMLEAAGVEWRSSLDEPHLSLLNVLTGDDPEHETAFAEVYPPLTMINVLRSRQPELIERFRCLALKRAIVQRQWKLTHADTDQDALFDLHVDTLELDNLLGRDAVSAETEALDLQLSAFIENAEQQRDGLTAGATFELHDERILQQLRGLGYIE